MKACLRTLGLTLGDFDLMQLSFLVMGTFLDDTAMLVIGGPLYVPVGWRTRFDLVWYGVAL